MSLSASGLGMTSPRARARMIERLRADGIAEERVLAAIAAVPRHLFVEEALASRAYEDSALPLGFSQTISQPFIVARMIEILMRGRELGKTLEIGAGSGYQAAVCQRHTQNGVARFQNRSVHGLVGLGAGVRLDIDIFCAKQLFSAINRQLFNNINVFAATVVAFARIAFSIFVGQLRTLGFHNGTADVVFRGDQLDVVLLALVFLGDGCCQIGVILCEGNAF